MDLCLCRRDLQSVSMLIITFVEPVLPINFELSSNKNLTQEIFFATEFYTFPQMQNKIAVVREIASEDTNPLIGFSTFLSTDTETEFSTRGTVSYCKIRQ